MSVNTYLNGSLVNAATTSHIQTGPADQASVLPEASSTLLNRIIQYTGTTTSNYINGYFYKCVQISDDPVTYGWVATQIKPAQTAAETPYESSNVQDTIDALLASIGYSNDHVIGLEADFENSTFRRLGGAKNKSAGSDFNVFNMYGERKLCNLADDGTITAWYGDPNYTETGYTTIVDPDTQEESTIQVQVMVRQPKFYYKVVPIKLEPITSTDPTQTGVHGYSGVKMNYYISDKPLPGFKLHPAFINANGDEVDCYYIGAYEACLYDVSESEYRLYDSWNVTYDSETEKYTVVKTNQYLATTSDKLSSIAGVKPASGDYSTAFTRANVSTMARNRGSGWDSLNIKIVAAEQLLMAIEYASFNSQANIGQGVVDMPSGYKWNSSAFTGSTHTIGNGSGSASSTKRLRNNSTLDTYTTDGRVSIRYRGVEDFWGNIFKYIDGVNVWGDGTMIGGEPYIADDYAYAESKKDGNYKPIGFTLPYDNGSSYIKYFGYSENYDWIFLPSKMGGNSSTPVGDSLYATNKLNGYMETLISGNPTAQSLAGAYNYKIATKSEWSRVYSARLIKV